MAVDLRKHRSKTKLKTMSNDNGGRGVLGGKKGERETVGGYLRGVTESDKETLTHSPYRG